MTDPFAVIEAEVTKGKGGREWGRKGIAFCPMMDSRQKSQFFSGTSLNMNISF